MNCKNIIVGFLLGITTLTFGQTKQDIYCNPNITWAGEVDIDIIVNADSTINWKAYRISHLDSFFKQKIKPLQSQEKTLNELIMSEIETIQFYEYDSLKYKKEFASLNLTDPLYEPENYGDQGGRLPADAFNVIRLRAYIYYDISKIGFSIEPKAIAVLRPLYDMPSEILGYDVLGWLPVDKLQKALSATKIDFRAVISRDISFEQIRIFKQEWTKDKVMELFIAKVRKQAATIEIFEENWDGELEKMTENAIQKVGTDELMVMRFDEFDPKEQFVPWAGSLYSGLKFKMNWYWDDEQFHIQPLFFAPLYPVENDSDVIGFQTVFYKSMKE